MTPEPKNSRPGTTPRAAGSLTARGLSVIAAPALLPGVLALLLLPLGCQVSPPVLGLVVCQSVYYFDHLSDRREVLERVYQLLRPCRDHVVQLAVPRLAVVVHVPVSIIIFKRLNDLCNIALLAVLELLFCPGDRLLHFFKIAIPPRSNRFLG